jgi:hypothetical protein
MTISYGHRITGRPHTFVSFCDVRRESSALTKRPPLRLTHEARRCRTYRKPKVKTHSRCRPPSLVLFLRGPMGWCDSSRVCPSGLAIVGEEPVVLGMLRGSGRRWRKIRHAAQALMGDSCKQGPGRSGNVHGARRVHSHRGTGRRRVFAEYERGLLLRSSPQAPGRPASQR